MIHSSLSQYNLIVLAIFSLKCNEEKQKKLKRILIKEPSILPATHFINLLKQIEKKKKID